VTDAAEARPSRWFEPATPRVLAHRGLHVTAPENTMLAFAEAVALGLDYIETDVHATRDGVAVISHDPDLRRLAGRDQRLLDVDWAEVASIRLARDQGLPSLVEALDAFPDTRFNIDVKSDDAVEPTIQAVRRAGAVDRVLVTSFDESRRARVVAGLPGVATSASSRRVVGAIVLGLVPFTSLRRRLLRSLLRGCGALQVPERRGPVVIVTSRRVADLAAVGVETHVWTIDEPDDMRRLIALGVAGIVSDRPDLAVAALR
jgi:glycerophosphoryl diester phosphodiesterase